MSQSGCGIKSGINTTFWHATVAPRSAEKNKRAWCGRCMDPFERCWNVCAKPARGRVHPVAVVTASSRMSRNSRARWPPVLQPTGAPCEGCPMCIHPDDRPRRTAAREPHIGSTPIPLGFVTSIPAVELKRTRFEFRHMHVPRTPNISKAVYER